MRKVFVTIVVVCCVFGTLIADTYVGRVDTIGGTTHDWQLNGPAVRVLCNSPEYGVYALWMHSAEEAPFNDRNMRLNFYYYQTRSWVWIDPDFMGSGINVYTERSGFGNLAVEPGSGEWIAVTHQRSSGQAYHSVLAHQSLGFCPGPDSFYQPVVAVGKNGWIHIAMTDQWSAERVFYSRCTTWCNWTEPILIGEPGDINYNITASLVSDKVAIVWVKSILGGGSMDSLFYRYSTNGGTSWSEPILLLPPPTFGGDTATSFCEWGPFPYYDKNDRLHIVVPVMPVVNSNRQTNPAAIWHWCETNFPQWSLVHRAGCARENLKGSPGYYATYACRPSIGEGSRGVLYVTWEQFDSLNVEPVTNRLRAGIWLTSSTDNGETWLSPLRLTPIDSVSHRFPCIIDQMVSGGPETDTVVVLYMIDSIAGFYAVWYEGPMSRNPIVCQCVAQMVGIEDSTTPAANSSRETATIVRSTLFLSPRLSAVSHKPVLLLDISGRKVLELKSGANDLRHLAPGVYFIKDGSAIERKAVITK
ncbi:MAG: hypothetical protein ABIK39_02820 [candidate division WOR-3 bacterium]